MENLNQLEKAEYELHRLQNQSIAFIESIKSEVVAVDDKVRLLNEFQNFWNAAMQSCINNLGGKSE